MLTHYGAETCVFFKTTSNFELLNYKQPNSFHTGGVICGLGDGSIRFVSSSISGTTFWAACTPANSDTLGSDW
ncbi:H-X9-DG-CTERM domain-containing protein [Fimbriiglobus ruber]|uniref:H-X9-DG-CTERM domain-containing protein n=1 Tax=Fimbriiglobus ruber TaxID=1908690 RepID=UPI001179AA1E|nr:H-X9-DG-CTERM domain-containing protein [Fimbriiglobus ruber]